MVGRYGAEDVIFILIPGRNNGLLSPDIELACLLAALPIKYPSSCLHRLLWCDIGRDHLNPILTITSALKSASTMYLCLTSGFLEEEGGVMSTRR